MKNCFFQIFRSLFSQPFLAIASLVSTPNNHYCFIISLNPIFSWFSRNPSHNIIAVLRSIQISFPHLMTPFVHKISHNLAHIIISCNLRFAQPGDLNSTNAPVSKLRRLPNCFENLVISLQLFCFSVEEAAQNQTTAWLVSKLGSQVNSIFHFLGFSNILKTITPYISTDSLIVFISFNICHQVRVVKVLGHSTNFSPILDSQQTPRSQLIRNQQQCSIWVLHNYQPLALVKNVFPPKPYSMSPLARDTKVIVVGAPTHMFLELLQLKLYLKYFRKYASEITSTQPPSTWSHHAHTFYDLLPTPLGIQLVPYSKLYSPKTSTPKFPNIQCQLHGIICFTQLPSPLHLRVLHNHHQQTQNPYAFEITST